MDFYAFVYCIGSAKGLYACIYWKKWRFGRVTPMPDTLTDRQQKIVLLSFSTVSSLSWVTQYKYVTCEVDIEHTPSRGSRAAPPCWTSSHSRDTRSSVRGNRESSCPAPGCAVGSMYSKDLVGEGMSCKTFFVLAILRKENWVLSTSKVPELLSELVFGRKAMMGQTWPHSKHSGPEWPCWERTWLTWWRICCCSLF